jgi:hypothetical protein
MGLIITNVITYQLTPQVDPLFVPVDDLPGVYRLIVKVRPLFMFMVVWFGLDIDMGRNVRRILRRCLTRRWMAFQRSILTTYLFVIRPMRSFGNCMDGKVSWSCPTKDDPVKIQFCVDDQIIHSNGEKVGDRLVLLLLRPC